LSESLKELQEATNRLVTKTKPREPLPAPVSRPSIGAGVGFAEPQTPTQSGVGGIASPLTETDFSKREYHPEQIVMTTDGMITESRKRIKKVVMVDALRAGVVFQYAAPVSET
jgi:hypothetical protein